MRRAALIAALMLSVAAPSRAETKASAASIAKLQKLAGRVRGLKKGVVVVPARKAAAKVAAKASKAGKAAKSSAVRSNKVSRLTALRSLYRQMAALDYRSCRVANLPKASVIKANAGLHRLAVMGERAAIADDADLEEPDSDADLAQDCGVCPSGMAAAGDDLYGLCYCADSADLAAAEAAVSSATVDTAMASAVDASSTAVAAAISTAATVVPDVDTTIARLSRFEKVANHNLSGKAAPKALPRAKIPAVAEWHYQRGQIYERMAAAATKPAFAPVRVGKDGKPQLAGVATSAQLRRLAAQLRSGVGPVTVARPAAGGGFATLTIPRSLALRNTYTMMAALDLRAARLAGLPRAQAKAARTLYGHLANLSAGARVTRKAAEKSGKKDSRKAGTRIADDEDGGDSSGGEVSLGVEPVVYVDNSGGDSSSGGSSDFGSSDSGGMEQPVFIDQSSGGTDSSSYADSGSGDGSGDSGSADYGSGDSGSGDSSSLAGSGDSGPGDSGGATAYQGADDNSGFGPTGLEDSQENAVNSGGGDNSGSEAASGWMDTSGSAASGSADNPGSADGTSNTAWGAADLAGSNENAVADPYAGTPMADPGYQDPGTAGTAAWGALDLAGSNENAVADNSGSAAPSDGSQGVGPDDLGSSPNDGSAAASAQTPDNADALAAAGQDNGAAPPNDALGASSDGSCSGQAGGAGVYRKAGNRKAGNLAAACMAIAMQLYSGGSDVPTLQANQYAPVDVQDVNTPQPDPIPYPAPEGSGGLDPNDAIVPNPVTAMGSVAESEGVVSAVDDVFNGDYAPGDYSYACMSAGLCADTMPTHPDPIFEPQVAPSAATTTNPQTTPAPTPPKNCSEYTNPEDVLNCLTPRAPGQVPIKGLVRRSKLACGPKSRMLFSSKAGASVCAVAAKKSKVAGMRKANKPLYSRLASLDSAAMKASRGLATRETPRAKKAMLLYQRGQLYARMAFAIAAPPRARHAASRRTAEKPQAQKAEKVASKASPKSSAKPAKPVVSDDVPAQPAPEQPAVEQPAPAETQAPAQPSAEELLKKSEQEMDDMGKDMENQIRQRGGR